MSTPSPVVRSSILSGLVVSNVALTHRLYSLRIAAQLLPFEAGQFVRLELSLAGDTFARPYSLVNAPTDPVAEVFFNTVPGGVLSNALAQLQGGDYIGISQPATGFFVIDGVPAAKTLWMFATGTGLGPYLSMLRTQKLWQRFENVVLVHGVPLVEELVYQANIVAAARSYPHRFHATSCVSREQNSAGLQGRITDALASGELEKRVGIALSPDDSSVMLCGNHSMISDMQALLQARGMRRHLRHKPGHVVTEQYF
jgi:ferredoxin--NADP+ reductase